MEPIGSLPCSQEPAIGPCPEPDASSSHLPTLFPYDPLQDGISKYVGSLNIKRIFFSNAEIPA